jgi:hypothetical protein
MNQKDRVKLLLGPYYPPELRRGDRAYCFLRCCEVTITGLSNGRIPWPRCRANNGLCGGGSGLLINEVLASAIQHESAVAIQYWWGVGVRATSSWRRALAVSRTNNKGTRRLIRSASQRGACTMKLFGLSDKVCDRMSERSKRLNLIRFAKPGYHGPRWTRKELQLLGTISDEKLAAEIGRTITAVRVMRLRHGIAINCDKRRTRVR